MRKYRQLVFVPLVVLSLSACGTGDDRDAVPPGSQPWLSAELVSPTDIALRWRDGDSGAAGHILEFATEQDGPYTILQFLTPGQSTYHHGDLIPETTFYHRIRPFFGPVSEPVEVMMPPGEFTGDDQRRGHGWMTPRSGGTGAEPTVSIRDPEGPANGAPKGLTATVMHPNGLRLTWHDRARDEEAHLLESRPKSSAHYTVIAQLDPDTDSFGIITLPTEKQARYRVRAVYFGSPSPFVRHRTGGPR